MKVVIDKLGINGEGVARGSIESEIDKVCFVPFALPDEEVEVEIVQDKKNYFFAKLNNIISKSSRRIEPICKYYYKCGGCDLQHMDKLCQLEFKKNKIEDTISKISAIKINVEDTIQFDEFCYRNKMVYPIVNTGKSLKIGMFSRSSHSIVDIDKCLLCNNIINSVYSVSKEYFESSSKFKGYDFKKKIGDLKYLVIRVGNDKILVTIVAKKSVNLNDYWNVLNTNFNNIGLSLIISDSDDEIISGKYTHLFGLESLDLEEFGIKYSINNLGFMQVNDKIKFELYNRVLDEINCQDTVIDCYSGAGLLSAIISKKCNKVIGIEINKSASNSAKNLAKTNNLNNIQFINGDVKDNIQEVLNNNPSSIIVLDPPRSGCERLILESINEKNVGKIIYISCNPATLARDISILKEKFEVSKVIPWDMFPQTKHVETLVILERVVF